MSDEKDIPQNDEAPPAEAPVAPTTDEIAAIVTAAIDARIPALQSGYDKQIADLKTQLRQSSMDEDEIETEQQDTLRAALDKSQAETAALLAAQSYPDAFPVFQKLNAATDAAEQLKLISELQTAAGATLAEDAPVAPPAPDAPAPVVDPNNPRTEPADGLDMTADKAASIIKAYKGIWPGRG